MWACRATSDITADFIRGKSFVGNSIIPYPTEELCRQKHPDCEPVWVEDVRPWDLYDHETQELMEELGYDPDDPPESFSGYLPAREGLCAVVGDTPAEALIRTLYDWDGPTGDALYLFPCYVIGSDDDDWSTEHGARRVKPAGNPVEVPEEVLDALQREMEARHMLPRDRHWYEISPEEVESTFATAWPGFRG
jgi:hypothetical protein